MKEKITYVHIVCAQDVDEAMQVRLRRHFGADVMINDNFPWHKSLSTAVAFARAHSGSSLLILTNRTPPEARELIPKGDGSRMVMLYEMDTVKTLLSAADRAKDA